MKIKDFMTCEVITVRKEMSVKEFVYFLDAQGISGAPVTEENNRVLGVISITDIIQGSKRLYTSTEQVEVSYEVDPCSGSVEIHKHIANELFETTIDTMMTRNVAALSPEDTLQDAINIFFDASIHRILVMEDEQLIGIITTKDALRALVKLRDGS